MSDHMATELHNFPPAPWVVDMIDHYHRTGCYRPEDVRRLLGDPMRAVTVGPSTSPADLLTQAKEPPMPEPSAERPRPVPPPRKPPPAGPTAGEPRLLGDAPPKPAKDRGPVLRFQCGHELPAGSLTGQPCPACRNKRREEKARQKRAAREAHRAVHPRAEIGRLPPGSAKRLLWNGLEWYGVLDVPGCPAFECRAGGEKACYHGLDAKYREYLAQQAGEAT